MDRRTLAPLVFVPIGVFLTIMLAVAVFVTHPPALGWIGLGVASLVALLAGTVIVLFFPRARTNADRAHPQPSDRYRLLVVADSDVEPGELESAVKLRLVARHGEILVVAPVLTPSPLHFLADDEDTEHAAAERRLAHVLDRLAQAGVEARGIVGTDDPLQAAADALVEFHADEILLLSTVEPARGWQEHRFERQARDVFGVPVTTVYVPRTVKAS